MPSDSAKVYVGGVDKSATETDLQMEFDKFGRVISVWIARKPPGFAFVEFEDKRDALDAVARLDGVNSWRVQMSNKNSNKSSSSTSRPSERERERSPRDGYKSGHGGGYGRERRERARERERESPHAYDRYGRPLERYGRRRSRSPAYRRSYSPDRGRGSPDYN